MGQDRREISEINPCVYGQLIYAKGAKNTQWIKNGLFSVWSWVNWTASCRRTKSYPYLPHIQLSSQNGLKTSRKTENIKTLEENIRITSLTSVLAKNECLDLIPKVQATETKIKKWYYVKLKCFCASNEIINIMKRQPMIREKIFTNHMFNKGVNI